MTRDLRDVLRDKAREARPDTEPAEDGDEVEALDVRLTEAEREDMRIGLAKWSRSAGRVEAILRREMTPAVERILAARLAAAEGQRMLHGHLAYENRVKHERADAAEARHAALVAAVEALRDEYATAAEAHRLTSTRGEVQFCAGVVADLSAIIAEHGRADG